LFAISSWINLNYFFESFSLRYMFIIPAIDLINGQCVRLSQGDFSQKIVYAQDPVEMAQRLEDQGATRLHLVDLDGAKQGRVVHWSILEAIARKTNLCIDFGGGIKTQADVQRCLSAGASMATIGSVAVKQPDLFAQWLAEFGAAQLLLGADVKGEKLAVGGWLETTDLSIFDFIATQVEKGLLQFFCTDISKDGQLQGPALELYRQLRERFPQLELIASGGVSCAEDLKALQEVGCTAAIVGKALYEGKVSLNDGEIS
jgi:phosphoribosylformimino-5-aminoimidazole carboxamide ribotide isomerase